MSQKNRKIIYSKKIETKFEDYYYYVIRKGDEYYVEVEVINYDYVTPTVRTNIYGGKHCLKVSKKEVKEIIELLKEEKYQEFEEKYGDKNWITNC